MSGESYMIDANKIIFEIIFYKLLKTINNHFYFDRFAFEIIVSLQGLWVMIAIVTSNKVMTSIKTERKEGQKKKLEYTQSTPLRNLQR